MSDGNLTISFGADTGAFRQGCDQAMAAVSGIAPRLQTLCQVFGALAGGAKLSFASVTTSAQAQQAAQTDAVVDAAATQRQVSDQTAQHVRDNNDRTLAGFKATMDQTVAAFSKGLLQMAEGSKSFSQVMARVDQQLLNDFVTKVIDPAIEKWLWKEARLTLAHLVGIQQRTSADATAAASSGAIDATANREQITQDAKVAAANVWKSISAIPIIGPFLAPPAAAAAFAAVEAFSAAGGFDVPAGVNPLTRLHAQEMVLPARLANPMRDMLAGFGGASGAGGGDTHLHYAPQVTEAKGSFRQQLQNHASDLMAMIASAQRNGALKLA